MAATIIEIRSWLAEIKATAPRPVLELASDVIGHLTLAIEAMGLRISR